MIASLRGRLAGQDAGGLIVEVGGVGLRVHATRAAAALAAADPVSVHLHTHLVVREDALTLYGFASEGEREVFPRSWAWAASGPSGALAIVSAYSPEALQRAVATDDVGAARDRSRRRPQARQRIVLDLKSSLGALDLAGEPALRSVASAPLDDRIAAREALVALGFALAEAEEALDGSEGDAEERIRHALGTLGARA